MTKPVPPRPEPTTGTEYDSYLVPRSKTPEKTVLYNTLLDLGWRFDSHHMLWHTPEKDTLQGFGRLEYTADYSVAWVQPPKASPEDSHLPTPLIRLRRVEVGPFEEIQWVVTAHARS